MLNRKNITIGILAIYSWLNLKLFYPFLFGEDHSSLVLALGLNSNNSSLLALFVGLFLNTALVLYWIKHYKDLE